MYVSDYGYAASDECKQNLYDYNNITCKTNNWLHIINVNEWLLSQLASFGFGALCVDSDGRVIGNIARIEQHGVRPVLYLTSSAKITGGSGTSSDPYTFGL